MTYCDPAVHKAATLAHCLALAERDVVYALYAASWYESNEPRLLANLRLKVQQEIDRKGIEKK